MTAFELALLTLRRGQPCVWLQVVASEGSSPGRAGFRMVVAPDGLMAGSIGGGIMEHKLVELARHHLATAQLTGDWPALRLRRQVHRAEAGTERSGMICSGEQTVLLLPLLPTQAPRFAELAAAVAARQPGGFSLTADGWQLHSVQALAAPTCFTQPRAGNWCYQERFDPRATLHVIGAGHVGLACCELLSRLDFRICLYDDRPTLNTLSQNTFADFKRVVTYDTLGEHLPGGPDHYAALMTFGYRSDAVAVRQLLGKPLRFLGMLGSAAKIARLRADLLADGYSAAQLAHLHAPIGLPIQSRTPLEIAVSVAAQLIQVRAAANGEFKLPPQ